MEHFELAGHTVTFPMNFFYIVIAFMSFLSLMCLIAAIYVIILRKKFVKYLAWIYHSHYYNC